MPPTNTAPAEDLKTSSLFSVEGLVAVVTGGATGIGLMIAKALATNGAKVYIIGRRQDALDATTEHHGKETSGSIISIQGDISSKASLDLIVKEIEEKEGYINLLVANAGIAGPKNEEPEGSATEIKKKLYDSQDFAGWADVFKTDVAGVYFTTLAFLELLSAGTKNTKGYSSSVIVISSISGLTKESQGHMAYNSAKAGTIHLTRMMANAFTDLKIRVNTIAPGVFPSEMTGEGSDEKNNTTYDKDMPIPAGRPGDIVEMAGTAIYLASRAGVYTNGIIIPIDGGFLLSGPSSY